MKSIKIILLLVAVGILALPNQINAQATSNQSGLGLGVKASTNGLGLDLIYALNAPVTLRLGFEKVGYKTVVNFDEQGIQYAGNLTAQVGSISLLADYYISNNFFLSVGVAKSLLKVGFEGKATENLPFGDIEIPVDLIGDFNFTLSPKSGIMPYFGLGLGRTIGLNKDLGFAFEVGTFYQGLLGIDITSSGLLSPTSNPDHGHAARLEKQVTQYVWYPVGRISLNYKLTTF